MKSNTSLAVGVGSSTSRPSSAVEAHLVYLNILLVNVRATIRDLLFETEEKSTFDWDAAKQQLTDFVKALCSNKETREFAKAAPFANSIQESDIERLLRHAPDPDDLVNTFSLLKVTAARFANRQNAEDPLCNYQTIASSYQVCVSFFWSNFQQDEDCDEFLKALFREAASPPKDGPVVVSVRRIHRQCAGFSECYIDVTGAMPSFDKARDGTNW